MNFMDSFSLAGKKALVLCPEYNYGPELVQGLLDGGAKVWVAGAKDLGLPGVEGFFPFHHTDAEEAAKLSEYVKTNMGTLDVLVENVLNMDTAPGWDHSFDAINQAFQATMKGMMLTIQALGYHLMAEQGFGSLILTSDYGALVGYDPLNYEECPEYFDNDFSLMRGFIRGACVNTARQASNYLTEHGCRCNAIAFGPLAGKQPAAFEEAYIRHSQTKRLLTAQDIAHVVTFLASDASAFISGQTLPVDGGYTAK